MGNRIGEAMGYAAYLLGGSVFVGAARAVDAGAHCLKHVYYEATVKAAMAAEKTLRREEYNEAKRQREERAGDEGRKVKRTEKKSEEKWNEVKQAKGLKGNLKAFGNFMSAKAEEAAANLSSATTEIKNAVEQGIADVQEELEDFVDEVQASVIELKERPLRDEWLSQFVRGIIEMIPIVGGIVGIIMDFNHKASDLGIDPGFLEIKRWKELHQVEKEVDDVVSEFEPKYQPLFH